MIWKWIKDERGFIHDLYTDAAMIKPWLLNQATLIWTSLKKLDDFVNIAVKMDIGNGENMRF
jgi:hypothetical protein